MAITNDFFTALNDPKAALWSAGVAFNRSNSLPLDKWSVFQSKEEAINYAENNAVAYPGQIIAVYENETMQAYVLAEENSKLNLQPIGIIPTGDGAISISDNGVISIGVDGVTIEVIDNALTLVGYKDAQEGAQLIKTKNGLGWIKPDNSIITELSETVQELSSNFDTMSEKVDNIFEDVESLKTEKANVADVYTKDETNSAIETAIAQLDHLKRKVVISTEVIDVTDKDAEQYIYMVPNKDGAYDEYMVLNGELERVGDWKVNLDDYATKDELTAEVNRAKLAEAEALETAQTAQENLDNLETEFEELSNEVAGKADVVYYPTINEITGEVEQVPGAFLSPEDQEKLAALVIDKDGNVGMSGSVNAENVEGLGTWLTKNGNTYIANIGEDNLSQPLLEQINLITSVEPANFQIVNGELKLNKIAQSQIDGLEETLSDKATIEGLQAVDSKVGDLNKIINGYVDEETQTEVLGLTEQISKLNTKVYNLEQSNLGSNYVTKVIFNKEVDNLNNLINENLENITALGDNIDFINQIIMWHDIDED